jgi:hypothetical protein
MSRKVFAAGEILTAADSNEFLIDQNVMSFADSTARGSAIGTAVQGMVTYLNDIDSLSVYNANDWTVDRTIQVFADSTARGSAIGTAVEGMGSWLEDSKRLSVYNGSSWASLGSEPTLVHLYSSTFSTVASHSVDNVFSSTYTNYKIVVNVTAASIDDDLLRIRVRASGSDLITTTYESGQYLTGVRASIAPANVDSNASTGNTPGWLGTTVGFGAEILIQDPFTETRTKISTRGAGNSLHFTGSVVNNAVSYDGFSVLCNSGTITGKVSLYGIRES